MGSYVRMKPGSISSSLLMPLIIATGKEFIIGIWRSLFDNGWKYYFSYSLITYLITLTVWALFCSLKICFLTHVET